MAIGLWDNSNVVFAILPGCEREVKTASQNTGEVLVYNGPSAGSTITSSMESLPEGFGYYYDPSNPEDSYYIFDGSAGYLDVLFQPAFTNVSKCTINFWEDLSNGFDENVAGNYENGGQERLQASSTTGGTIRHQFLFTKGGTTKYARTNSLGDTLKRMITLVKDGSTLKIYKDGTEVSSYEKQDSYTLGDLTFSTNLTIGYNGSGYIKANSKIYQYIWYDDALSDSAISDLYSLESHLGYLGGTDNGDGTITLTYVPNNYITTINGVTSGVIGDQAGLQKQNTNNRDLYHSFERNGLKYILFAGEEADDNEKIYYKFASTILSLVDESPTTLYTVQASKKITGGRFSIWYDSTNDLLLMAASEIGGNLYYVKYSFDASNLLVEDEKHIVSTDKIQPNIYNNGYRIVITGSTYADIPPKSMTIHLHVASNTAPTDTTDWTSYTKNVIVNELDVINGNVQWVGPNTGYYIFAYDEIDNNPLTFQWVKLDAESGIGAINDTGISATNTRGNSFLYNSDIYIPYYNEAGEEFSMLVFDTSTETASVATIDDNTGIVDWSSNAIRYPRIFQISPFYVIACTMRLTSGGDTTLEVYKSSDMSTWTKMDNNMSGNVGVGNHTYTGINAPSSCTDLQIYPSIVTETYPGGAKTATSDSYMAGDYSGYTFTSTITIDFVGVPRRGDAPLLVRFTPTITVS